MRYVVMPEREKCTVILLSLTWHNIDSWDSGTKPDNELDWRISFLWHLHFKGTHVILEEYSWYTMRSLVMINGTFMILHWVLVSSESTQECVHFCWYNIHKILEQHGIYKLQIYVVIKNQYNLSKGDLGSHRSEF